MQKSISVSENTYAHVKPFLADVALTLLENSTLLSLIDTVEDLGQKLKNIREDDTEPSSFFKRKQKISNSALLSSHFAHHRHILSCPTDDEHVVFLSALKALEETGERDIYRSVIKEVLKNNLHKIQFSKDLPFFVGRQKEINEILGVFEKSARNNVLITGPGGIGKTALAQAACQKFPTSNVYQLFPGSSSFFDHITSLIASNEKKPLFFLDEIFSFEKEHIQYLVENAQFISTANDHSYKKFSAENPGIVSKMEVIQLNEPSTSEVEKILTHYTQKLQGEKQITFEDGFLYEVIALSKQYLQNLVFPAKGISLVEESVSMAIVQKSSIVTCEIIKSIVSQKTNIPIGSLTEFDKKDLSELPAKLSQKVKGQDEAITKVARVIQRSKLGFGKKNRPIGSFLFVGPSGVGKTELAKAVAQEIFGDTENMVRLDMSEFAEAHTVQRLIGAPPGYIGYEEGGQLTNPVKAKPYNLILLDEIEKAHPRVFDIFLQVLDDGRLTDGQGKVVDFRNTIIIATSNAGIEDILDLIEEGKTQEEIIKELKEVLQDYFRIEFINRFDDIIVFNALTPPALEKIAALQIEKLQIELSKRDIQFSVSTQTLAYIAKESYDPRYGARGLLRFIQDKIENKLAEMIIEGKLVEGQRIEF